MRTSRFRAVHTKLHHESAQTKEKGRRRRREKDEEEEEASTDASKNDGQAGMESIISKGPRRKGHKEKCGCGWKTAVDVCVGGGERKKQQQQDNKRRSAVYLVPPEETLL